MLLAYFAPEVALPVSSALAAVTGFVLLVGRSPLRAGLWLVRRAASRGKAVAMADVRSPQVPASSSVHTLTDLKKSGKTPDP